uniref:G-protein coupled receptors family 1 profile domain-containing protein n=2 Tax=Ditylum brightwellii TaxID=49249 RepID=A0A7S4SJ62_9STRA
MPFDVSPFSCLDNARNELIVEIISRTGGLISTLGSSLIVEDILKKVYKGKQTDPYQRIMLGLSLCDILISTFLFALGTWMVPKETGWLWAVGNTASCSAQGFFWAFGGAGELFYQMAISLNILLLIVFGWKQETFRKKVEKPLHIIIIALALTMAVIPLAFQTYNPHCGNCYPEVMYDACTNKKEGNLCIVRGNETVNYMFRIINGALFYIALIFCTVAMLWVYLHVRKQEVKMQRYNFRQHNAENHKESKRIRKVLFLYTLSLYFTYTPHLFVVSVPKHIRWSVVRTLPPLLGFWNMLVYFLPNCLKYQREHSGTWLVIAYFQVLRPRFPCVLSLSSGMCKRRKKDVEDAPEMNFAKINTANEESSPPPIDATDPKDDLHPHP